MVFTMTELLSRLQESVFWFGTGYVTAIIVTRRSINPVRHSKDSCRG